MPTKYVDIVQLQSVFNDMGEKADERFLRNENFQAANSREMNNLIHGIFPSGVTISAGQNIENIPLYCNASSYTVQSMGSLSINMRSAEVLHMTAVMPKNVIGTKTYHDGVIPKEGNYYYTPATIYTFDGWKDGNDNKLSDNTQYSFAFKDKDITVSASATSTEVETNKIDAINISVQNLSPDIINSVSIDSLSNEDTVSKYIWPGEDVTINANYASDEHIEYTDNNSQARPDAYMYFINTNVIALNETDDILNIPLQANPNTSAVYRMTAQKSTSSSKSANSYNVSSLFTTSNASNGSSMTRSSVSQYTKKFYWNSSTETAGAQIITSSIKSSGPQSLLTWNTFVTNYLNAKNYTNTIVGYNVLDSNGHYWRIIAAGSNYYDLWYEASISNHISNTQWNDTSKPSKATWHYKNSELRTWLTGTVYNDTSIIPSSLKSKIITKTVNYSLEHNTGYHNETEWFTVTDSIWLLTSRELGGTTIANDVWQHDGSPYSYFNTTAKKSIGVPYWLTTGGYSRLGEWNGQHYQFYIDANGTQQSNILSVSIGVAPCVRVA